MANSVDVDQTAENGSLIRVYTICHSQQSDQGLHCLPFSAVWSVSTLYAMLSLIKVYTIWHLSSLIRVYIIFHSQQSDEGVHCDSQQSDQYLHYLPFSVVWSGSTQVALISKQYCQCLHCLSFSAVWSGSTLLAILRSLIKVKYYTVILRNSLNRFYTICHSQQSDQGLHYLPFSVWSGSTLFAILSILIRVSTTCHSQQSVILRTSLVKVYTIYHFQHSNQRLHCHSQQSDQGLHYFPFSAVLSRKTKSPSRPSGRVHMYVTAGE